ncbi:MAG: Hsp20/alpha crystallin family protein [Desulfovibrionales bacterium]
MNGLSLWKNQELMRLRDELDFLYERMCRDFGVGQVSWKRPKVSMLEHEDHLQVSIELPGIEPEDLDLSIVDDDKLILQAKKTQDIKRDHKSFRKTGSFSSSLKLPCKVKVEDVQATFREGVLVITMPKCPPPSPKRLQISS